LQEIVLPVHNCWVDMCILTYIHKSVEMCINTVATQKTWQKL